MAAGDGIGMAQSTAFRQCPDCPAASCAVRQFVEQAYGGRQHADVVLTELARGCEIDVPADLGAEFWIVAEGMVMVENALSDGRRLVTGFRAPGDLLYLFAPGQRVQYAMTALAATQICRVRAPCVQDAQLPLRTLIETLFEVARAQLVWADQHLLLLARLSAGEKVASFLLEMVGRIGHMTTAGAMIDLPMNREVIGDYLGLHSETVSRQLSRLKRRGVISLPRPGLVIIPDIRRLANTTPLSWSAVEKTAAMMAAQAVASPESDHPAFPGPVQ